jgi:spore coat protein U-like protein
MMTMRTRSFVVAAALTVACGSNSVELDASGASLTSQTRTLTCGDVVKLDRNIAGTGGISLKVTDGANNQVFQDNSDAAGQVTDSQDLTGKPGDWTITLDPSGFAGQFKVTLSCP